VQITMKQRFRISPEERALNAQRAEAVLRRLESERNDPQVAREWEAAKVRITNQTQEILERDARGQAATERDMRGVRWR